MAKLSHYCTLFTLAAPQEEQPLEVETGTADT
jgi:hypothetical protein